MNKSCNDVLMLFGQRSELLNLQKSNEDLDDAIKIFADWLASCAHELSEDDLVILALIGGIMYREALHRRRSPN